MPEPACCMEVHRHLVRHGLPAAQTVRVVQELVEHWEDLRAEARQEGLSEADAAVRANARLGCAEFLAREITAGVRRSSWFGRHPIVTLGFLPFLLTPLLMGVVIFPLWALDEWIHFSSSDNLDAVRNAGIISGMLWGIYGFALVASPLWICWRLWTAGLGFRWVLASCAFSALFSLSRYFDASASRRHVSFGVRFPWPLEGQTLLILGLHLLLAAGILIASWRALHRPSSNFQNSNWSLS